MAFFEDVLGGILGNGLRGTIIGSVALGVGAIILAPILLPAARKVGKPLAKGAIKGGIMVFQKSKELVAETSEAIEDIVAEAKAELVESRKATADAAAACVPKEAPVAEPA